MSHGKYDRKLFNTSPPGATGTLSLLDEFSLVLVQLRIGLLKREASLIDLVCQRALSHILVKVGCTYYVLN